MSGLGAGRGLRGPAAKPAFRKGGTVLSVGGGEGHSGADGKLQDPGTDGQVLRVREHLAPCGTPKTIRGVNEIIKRNDGQKVQMGVGWWRGMNSAKLEAGPGQITE